VIRIRFGWWNAVETESRNRRVVSAYLKPDEERADCPSNGGHHLKEGYQQKVLLLLVL